MDKQTLIHPDNKILLSDKNEHDLYPAIWMNLKQGEKNKIKQGEEKSTNKQKTICMLTKRNNTEKCVHYIYVHV